MQLSWKIVGSAAPGNGALPLAIAGSQLATVCELGITEITVKADRGQVMGKMKADSLADLVEDGCGAPPSGQRTLIPESRPIPSSN